MMPTKRPTNQSIDDDATMESGGEYEIEELQSHGKLAEVVNLDNGTVVIPDGAQEITSPPPAGRYLRLIRGDDPPSMVDEQDTEIDGECWAVEEVDPVTGTSSVKGQFESFQKCSQMLCRWSNKEGKPFISPFDEQRN